MASRYQWLAYAGALLLAAPVIQGCTSFSRTRVVSQSSDPFDHGQPGHYYEPPGSPPEQESILDLGRLTIEEIWENGRPPKGHERLPNHQVPVDAAVAAVAAAGNRDYATWLGHDTFIIQIGGVRILTDPFLSERASPVRWEGPRRWVPPGLPVDRLPPIDVILISHSHYDHLDIDTLEKLPHRNHIAVIVAKGVGRYLSKLGFESVSELDWFDVVDTHGLHVQAVPALHSSRRGLFDMNATLWCGFAIQGGHRSLWFAGDTSHGAVFAAAAKRLPSFDYGFIPIGAYAPRATEAGDHASPMDAVHLMQDMHVRTIIPMHWGTIQLSDEPVDHPPERLKLDAARAGIAPEKLWILRIGETRLLTP